MSRKWFIRIFSSKTWTSVFVLLQIILMFVGAMVCVSVDLILGGAILFLQFCVMVRIEMTFKKLLQDAKCRNNSCSGSQ